MPAATAAKKVKARSKGSRRYKVRKSSMANDILARRSPTAIDS